MKSSNPDEVLRRKRFFFPSLAEGAGSYKSYVAIPPSNHSPDYASLPVGRQESLWTEGTADNHPRAAPASPWWRRPRAGWRSVMRTRRLLFVVVVLALIALPAAAAPRSPVADRDGGIVSAVLDFMSALQGKLDSIWEKAGSGVDPFGGQSTTPPEDPDGGSSEGDAGSGVDPWGKP